MADTRSRDEPLELATRAKQAVHTPTTFMTEMLVQQQQYTCLAWLCHFQVLGHIPIPPSSLPYTQLAQLANVPADTLRAVSRMVITMGFLHEPSPGHVSHSALSAPFIKNAALTTWLLHMVNHTVPFMRGFAEATQRFGSSTKPTETAFNIAFATDLAYFPYLKTRPDLEREFDSYMRSQSEVHGGARADFLIDGFDWKTRLRDGAKIVDVGGGSGGASLAVARVFDTFRFVVQDQATPIEGARARKAAAEDEDEKRAWRRIELQVHDFFGPQTVVGADVYLLRMIIHDWPDDKAVVILRQLACALSESGDGRILIMDMVIPSSGSTSLLSEAALREKDLCMRQVFNAKERDTDDWYNLIASVEPPLRICSIKRPDGCQHSVIEVALKNKGAAPDLANGVSSGSV